MILENYIFLLFFLTGSFLSNITLSLLLKIQYMILHLQLLLLRIILLGVVFRNASADKTQNNA